MLTFQALELYGFQRKISAYPFSNLSCVEIIPTLNFSIKSSNWKMRKNRTMERLFKK